MAGETLRRRRPSNTAASARDDESTTSTVTTGNATREEAVSTDTSGGAAEAPAPKTMVELIDEEEKSHSQFLSFVGVVALMFLYMIRSTELPTAGRVTAVVIDAGSTGTRAQVFQFAHDDKTGRLSLNRTDMSHHKGTLASLVVGPSASSSSAATKFFRPILDAARKGVIGVRRRKQTPIIMRATAGLRLLDGDAAESAIDKARGALKASDFLFQEEYASVLDPIDEARFGWVSVNFLLGNFEADALPSAKVGTLEMGGASLQVVYSVRDSDTAAVAAIPAAQRHSAIVFREKYTLRARSYLGQGLHDAMRRMYSIFESEGVLEEGNPCFRRGKKFTNKVLRLGVTGTAKRVRVNMVGDGDFDRCVASADIAIGAAGGENSMSVEKDALPKGSTFYAFAFLFDRIVGLGLPREPTREQLVKRGIELCESAPGKTVDGDFDEACAEFSYVYAVLKILTDDFSKERGVKLIFEQFVNGHMLGWALAAALDVVEPTIPDQLKVHTDPVTLT